MSDKEEIILYFCTNCAKCKTVNLHKFILTEKSEGQILGVSKNFTDKNEKKNHLLFFIIEKDKPLNIFRATWPGAVCGEFQKLLQMSLPHPCEFFTSLKPAKSSFTQMSTRYRN